MAKGFIRGTLWGAGISFGAVTLLSLMTGEVGQRDFSSQRGSDAARANLAPGENRGKDGLGPTAAGLATEDVPAPEPDTLAALVAEALTPAAVPVTGVASALPQDTPEEGKALAGIAAPATEGPSVRYVEGTGLTTPATEPVYSISTDPAQPKAPEIVSQQTAFSEVTEKEAQPEARGAEGGDTAEEVLPEQPVPAPDVEIAALDIDPAQPVPPAVTGAAAGTVADEISFGTAMPDTTVDLGASARTGSTAVAALAPDAGLDTPAGPGPQVFQTAAQPKQRVVTGDDPALGLYVAEEPAAPEAAALTVLPDPAAQEGVGRGDDSADAQVTAGLSVVPPEAGEVVASEPVSTSFSDSEPAVTALAVIPPSAPRAEKPVQQDVQVSADPLEDTVPEQPDVSMEAGLQQAEVRVNRLPSLGGGASGAGTVETPATPVVPDEVAVSETPGDPLRQFSADFDAPAAKPLMAVVLIDEGRNLADSSTGIDAVKALPYPVSFAVDALRPDAVERMEAYRAAGFEVLAALDLPDGATASDAEVNVSFALEKLPEIIGVLEGTGTGVQTTPMAGRQVASILSETGHGLVTQNRGLNTVQKLAVREGVPALTVFRDLDSKGQTEVVIRRFMDQAAFRAGQDEGVVMLGRLRQETLAALVSWSLQDRASTVAMAPVSAVLLQPR